MTVLTPTFSRAQRFAIETTIRYRNVGQNEWYEGKTENISRSGVLFRAKYMVALRTRIEMNFPLPVGGPGVRGASVKCLGHVVREASQVGSASETGLAATIEHYQLMQAEEVAAA